MSGFGAPIGILLIDDHTMFREALRHSLETEDEFVIMGEAGDGLCAIEQAAHLQPTIILLDVGLPGVEVTDILRRLIAVAPHSRVLILTMYDDPALVRVLLKIGARGYLLKSANRMQLASAIRGVVNQDGPIVLSSSPMSFSNVSRGNPDTLSERERRVLELVATGLTNAQVGSRLCITEGTVKRHLHNIFTKLGAESRLDAVNRAAAASIIGWPGSGGPPGR